MSLWDSTNIPFSNLIPRVGDLPVSADADPLALPVGQEVMLGSQERDQSFFHHYREPNFSPHSGKLVRRDSVPVALKTCAVHSRLLEVALSAVESAETPAK